MKRTLVLGAAWTGSAAAAVGLGFLAVSLVDASASTGTVSLAAIAPTGSSDDPTAASTTTTTSGTRATIGGIVTASCAGGSLDVAGAPAVGWRVDDSDDPGKVEFDGGGREVEVRVTCVDGSPRFTVEGPRDEDDASPSRSAGTPAATDAPDDSDGRVGGGRGSDDPPGDDHGGRSGSDDSGSGSDDSGSDDSGNGGGSGGHGSDD